MSEKRSEDWEDQEDQEDQEVLRLLDELAEHSSKDPQALAEAENESASELRRSSLEALALLPFELDGVAPSPELKARILSDIGERDRGIVEDERIGAPDRLRGERATGYPRWLLPLAATLALVLIGTTGWQIWRVDRQDATIARLSEQLDRARTDAEELAAARELLAETRTRLEMVTASAAEFCALRAIQGSPYPDAKGTLVMLQGRNDWFLKVEGLAPCEAGRQYKLWFVTDEKPVLGASFAVEAGHEAIEIRASGAPTGIKAVMITLERPEVEEAPSAPAVLYGDERMQIL